jgi:hypothetical protein
LPISGDKYKFEGWNKGCDIKKREKRKKKWKPGKGKTRVKGINSAMLMLLEREKGQIR